MKLIFLVYALNNCYVKVVERVPNDVTVDFKKGTWYYDKKEYNIGNMRYCEHSRCGVIGVYDANKINHLDNMAHHAIEATRIYKLDLC
ncbi:hypothetical protein KKC04_03440 [Patescibacteria group bacterium]|nr:hypothetical protein [Patescibacteria group bacterium]MBU4347750.1 hypothetical protein [Patescibacteria group bacterium]